MPLTLKTKPEEALEEEPKIDASTVSEAITAADRYGDLVQLLAAMETMEEIKKYAAAQKEKAKLEKELRDIAKVADGDVKVTLTGERWNVLLGEMAEMRTIVDKGALIQKIQALDGGDELLFAMISIAIGDISNLFSDVDLAGIVEKQRTGSRKIVSVTE